MLGVQCLLRNEMLTKMTINNQYDHPNAGRVERLVSQLCWGRRIFTTDSSCMETETEILDRVDEVWILAGADLPMILGSLGGQRYRLFGESYVHGRCSDRKVMELQEILQVLLLIEQAILV